ncbi:MAG: lycopene cyclase domain-containing protein [Acidimicrobiales bacterium]
MRREYSAAALAAAVAVVGCELFWWRSGIFKLRAYWASMAVVAVFQVAVDGWLTKVSDPVVTYDPNRITGLRLPPGIPVEDFAYGFALVTMATALWERRGSEQLPKRASERPSARDQA